MSAPTICLVVLFFLALGAMVTFLILRDEASKRREWRPDGYRPGVDSTATVGDWWPQPLPAVGLRQSVRVIDAPPAAELVSVADPRIVRTNRHLSSPAAKRKPVERVRRVEKKRLRAARGSA